MGVCNAVYFRLCIDLMHILPPVTAEGYDGSHHPRYAERGIGPAEPTLTNNQNGLTEPKGTQ